MSFNTILSRLSSATNRFSFAFSCSSSLSRFAWSTCIPPYSLRQRKYVCSTISASLHACAVVFPFAIATSICRSRFTTCSARYRLPRAMRSPCSSVSLFHWYISSRALQAVPEQSQCVRTGGPLWIPEHQAGPRESLVYSRSQFPFAFPGGLTAPRGANADHAQCHHHLDSRNASSCEKNCS